MTTTGECIVHHRKYLSKFHQTINKIRQLNEFNSCILNRLPKRCCSCHGQTGESSISIDRLRELCQEIELSSKPTVPIPSPTKDNFDVIVLEISPTLTNLQRLYKVGRFIGRRGKNIALLQKQLNIRIDILNNKSSKHFRQTIEKFQKKTKENHTNDLWVLIRIKNNNENISQIKQSIENAWKQVDVTSRRKRTAIVQSPRSVTSIQTDISLDGDTRWTLKTKKKRKNKIKQNETIEQVHVPPQPFVRPISMPKQLPDRRKNQRK